MKQILAIFFCITIITACGNSPEESTTQTVPTQTVSFTSTVAITSSPTITLTPSHTPEPTVTFTPEPPPFNVTSLEQLPNFNWQTDWTLVKPDQFWEIAQAPPRQEIVFDNSTAPIEIAVMSPYTIRINGIHGESLFFQQAIAAELSPGFLYHVLMFKAVARDMDGQNKLVTLNVCIDLPPYESDFVFPELRIRQIGSMEGSSFIVVTSDIYYRNSTVYTFYEILVGDNSIRSDLRNGVVDDGIEFILLLNPQSSPFFRTK